MQIDVATALTEFDVKFEKTIEKYRVHCPFHNDPTPDCYIHHKTGNFNCFACGKKGTLIGFLIQYANLPIHQIKAKLNVKSDCKNPLSPQQIMAEHQEIWKHQYFLDQLAKRCITHNIIRQRMLGVHDLGTEKRISIPVVNDVGEYASCRWYMPGASSKKFLNISGNDRSKARLTPIEQLEFDRILICGGELKAYAAAEVLNKYDIGAIAPTCGETYWPNEYNYRFEGKLLYVNCDDDETGLRYAELRCRILKAFGREIYKVVLPHELFVEHNVEKGDINDYLRIKGDSGGEALFKLLEDTPEWKFVPGGSLEDEIPLPVTFREAYSAANVGKKMTFPAIVVGVHHEAFSIAKEVEVLCPRGQAFCMQCDVNSQALTKDTGTLMQIGVEHPALLALMREKTMDHTKTYKECFCIPGSCKLCTFKPKSHHNVVEVRLDEELEATSRQEALTMRVGYVVNGPATLDSRTYNLTGRLFPSPKTQVASFIVSKIEETENALDKYVSASSIDLQIFRPTEWTVDGIQAKLDEIYSDLEANVTRVWQRRDYHLAIDLVYHSILHFELHQGQVLNTYLQLLVIGDTAQAKSETNKRLKAHYNVGVIVDSPQATIAGLTIGLDQHNRNFATYGVLPRNDRMLVVFEELVRMKEIVWQSLTESRSSGYVSVFKIKAYKKSARVRLIGISNPSHSRKIASYAYGVDAAIGVVGTLQDLRRFDFVIILGENDIDQAAFTHANNNPPIIEHRFTDEICEKLILKAWKCENVEFEDKLHLHEVAAKLVDMFGDGLPILDSNSSHIKLAKIAAALAARTCSYEIRGKDEVLVVRKAHVEYIKEFLIRIYSSPSSKLDEKSRSVKESGRIRNKDMLIDHIRGLTNAADVMNKIIETDIITGQYCRDLCGDFHIGSSLFAKLVQCNALQKVRGEKYSKTPEFTDLIKTLNLRMQRPDYLEKREPRNF